MFAVFLGIAMCVSATPVIAKTLMDLKLPHRNVGRLILISGTVDDVLGRLGRVLFAPHFGAEPVLVHLPRSRARPPLRRHAGFVAAQWDRRGVSRS